MSQDYPNPKPFLKWAGGKTQLIKDIEKNFPFHKNESFSYIEPFVGSGAVLFWVVNNFKNLENIFIGDVNQDLINCYISLRDDIDIIIEKLKSFEEEFYKRIDTLEKKDFFYKKRELFNKRISDKTTQSALLIFLNKTCFNGLYRVNRKNEFNVPMGSYKKPVICDEKNLRSVCQSLKNIDIRNCDFEETADFAKGKTFFYLDPPYKPLSETSSFNSYSKDNFCDSEQVRLKLFCDKLTFLGHKWMLSNSDVKVVDPEDNFFDELYKEYTINRVLARRSINSNASKRGKLTELLITN